MKVSCSSFFGDSWLEVISDRESFLDACSFAEEWFGNDLALAERAVEEVLKLTASEDELANFARCFSDPKHPDRVSALLVAPLERSNPFEEDW